MKTWEEIKTALAQELDVDEIRWKDGWDGPVPYLAGDYVVRKLNEVFDADGWAERDASVSYKLFEREEEDKSGNKRKMYIACAIGKTTLEVSGLSDVVKTEGEPLIFTCEHTGEGVCSNKSSRPEAAIETAVKGAATDDLKRAAMKLGDPFGLCLYNKEYRESLSVPEQAKKAEVRDFPRSADEPQAERRTHCEKCGAKLVRRTGTSKKTGDPWAGWFCPNSTKDDKHPVVWED